MLMLHMFMSHELTLSVYDFDVMIGTSDHSCWLAKASSSFSLDHCLSVAVCHSCQLECFCMCLCWCVCSNCPGLWCPCHFLSLARLHMYIRCVCLLMSVCACRLSRSFGYLTKDGFCSGHSCHIFPVVVGETNVLMNSSVSPLCLKCDLGKGGGPACGRWGAGVGGGEGGGQQGACKRGGGWADCMQ